MSPEVTEVLRDQAGVVSRRQLHRAGLCPHDIARLFHDTTEQRDRDFDRDLATAAHGKGTVRLTYGQVFQRPCWTASHLGVLLQQHGWSGAARPCWSGCPAVSSGI